MKKLKYDFNKSSNSYNWNYNHLKIAQFEDGNN